MTTLPHPHEVTAWAKEAFKQTHGPLLGKTAIFKTVSKMVENAFVSGYLVGFVKGFGFLEEQERKGE